MASIAELLSLIGGHSTALVQQPARESPLNSVSDDSNITLPLAREEQIVEKIGITPDEVIQIKGLAIQPWPHQIRGFRALTSSLKAAGGCLAAAEMGVGKTLIATMLSLGFESRLTLIVCPLRVIGSWRDQLAQYIGFDYLFAELDDSMTVGKRTEKLKRFVDLAMASKRHLYVAINYDSFWRDPINDLIATIPWQCVIYDESHKLKEPTSRASNMARRIKAPYKILATGTHMAHSPIDVFGQWRAVIPSLFGTNFASFKKRYAVLGGPEKRWVTGYQNIDELEAKIAPFTWRATKEEVLPDLPDQVDMECPVEMSPEAMRVYRELEKNFITEVEGEKLTASNALTKVLRLQQITGGSVPTDDDTIHQIDDGKMKALTDLIEDVGKLPTVIFCVFRHDINMAHEACRKAGRKAMELSGKFNQLEAWQKGEGDDLIVQMQSGSVGIDLTRASIAIYYSLSTSLSQWDQSRARIHRPGQKNSCTFYYLIVKGSIDVKILAALRARQEVVKTIMTNIQNQRNGNGNTNPGTTANG